MAALEMLQLALEETPRRWAQLVKTFWQDYFAATGAILLDHNYAYRPVRLPEDPC